MLVNKKFKFPVSVLDVNSKAGIVKEESVNSLKKKEKAEMLAIEGGLVT